MRLFLFFALGSLACLYSGCKSVDSLPTRVRERFDPPQPQTRVFEANQHTVFDAAQIAIRRMDFRVTKAAAAQGIIKAISKIQPGDTFGDARQFSFEVNIEDLAAGKTQVSVILREQQESTAFSGATDIPLREHGLYESFFEGLAQALKEALAAPPKAE